MNNEDIRAELHSLKCEIESGLSTMFREGARVGSGKLENFEINALADKYVSDARVQSKYFKRINDLIERCEDE